ncbi:hypothetical protein [Pseudoxanthomonas mexicana]|uniref:hypothetical protein n=1 Tax=Pseudoxanthomonas mexicana TaxID=128785 RepID=UPI00398B7FED
MPDANARERAPADWEQALSALPLETPPDGGWERLSPRLPRSRPQSPPRWRRWSAAAALLAAMALPWLAWKRPATDPEMPALASQSAPAAAERTARHGDAPESSAPAATQERKQADPPLAIASLPTPPTLSPRMATTRRNSPHAAIASAVARPASTPALEALYAESALLEELLVQAQPSPMASGPAMVVSDALQGHLADIDAALSAPALDGDDRRALWTQRVETLRQLAGVESTQRWLATEGGSGFISSVH